MKAIVCLALILSLVTVRAQTVDAGNVALKATNWTAAESIFRGVLANNSTNALALAGLAQSLLRQGRLGEALTSAEKAASLDSTNFVIQYRLAACYYNLHRYEEAQTAYAAALEIRPSSSVHFWRGMALVRLKRYAEAEKELDQAPPEAVQRRWWESLGSSWWRLHRYKDAIACYQKALALDPKSARDLEYLGDAQYNINDFASAALSYRRCFALEPANMEIAMDLADALYQLKSYAESVQTSQRALALDWKRTNLVADFQTTMNIGYCSWQEGKFDDAAEAYESASQLEPTNTVPYEWEAHSYVRVGSYRDAAEALTKAHQLNPGSREICLDLFAVDLMAGRDSQACRLFPIASGVGMAALLASIATGFFFLLRRSFRLSTATRPGIGFSVGWLLVSLEGQVGFVLLASFLFPLRDGANYLAGLSLSPLPLLAAASAFPRQPWGAAFRKPRELRWVLLGQAVLGLALIFGATQVYSFAFLALFHARVPVQRSLPFLEQMRQAQPALAVFAIVVIAPLAEEILFRGLLFGALEEKCGNWTILWTALAFALCHFDLFYFVPLTILGLLFGWARQKSGSVWLSVILHCLNNLVAIVALALGFERLH